MLMIDDSTFPLVWIKETQQVKQGECKDDSVEVNESFTALEKLFDRQTPFVIINAVQYNDDEKHQHSKQEKMLIAQWIKKNRINVRNFILAQIQVIPKNKQSIIMNGFLKTFSKFWGFPLIIADDTESAIKKANEIIHNSQ